MLIEFHDVLLQKLYTKVTKGYIIYKLHQNVI